MEEEVVATEKQVSRWAADWGVVKEIVGKRVDSVQFAAQEGKERVVVRFQDGIRFCIEAQPDGTVRAWLSCCGKPDGNPPPA
jgi:hypothetical protein